jgi:hypothetical protein
MSRVRGGAWHEKTVERREALAYIECCGPDSCQVGDSRLPDLCVQNNTAELTAASDSVFIKRRRDVGSLRARKMLKAVHSTTELLNRR